MSKLCCLCLVLAALATACVSHGSSVPRSSRLTADSWTALRVTWPAGTFIAQVAPGTLVDPWVAVGWTDLGGGVLDTACFLSPDGLSWKPCPLMTVDLDGVHTRLLSVGRIGRVVVAGGVAVGALHGNPRPTLWRMPPGQPLAELPLPREVFGGERIIGFNGLTASQRGGFAAGTWVGRSNQAVAQVWHTTDGADWERLDGIPALTSTAEENLRGSAVAVGGRRVVLVGAALHLKRLADGDDGAIWWSDDGRQWTRAGLAGARLTGPGYQELGVVAPAGDGFMAAGASSQTAAIWWSPDGRTWHAAHPLPGGRGSGATITSLTVLAGHRWAAGVVGGTPHLWSSPDGSRWTAEPLPTGLPISGAHAVTLAGGNGVLLAAVQLREATSAAVVHLAG